MSDPEFIFLIYKMPEIIAVGLLNVIWNVVITALLCKCFAVF